MGLWSFPWRFKTDDRRADGYADPLLIDVIVCKTAALQDTARLDDILPGETLLATVAGLGVAGPADPLRVLDFGGAAGLHYLVAKQTFPRRNFRWAVVETAQMADAALRFANDELFFFTSLEAAVDWLGGVDLVHCVSALQYAPEPGTTVEQLLALRARTVIWARLMLGDRYERFVQSSRLRDNGPGPLLEGVKDRRVTCSAVRMPKSEFLTAHEHSGYRLVWKSDATSSFLFLADQP
jgi:putative methyltransferase (TIGR04325 family)